MVLSFISKQFLGISKDGLVVGFGFSNLSQLASILLKETYGFHVIRLSLRHPYIVVNIANEEAPGSDQLPDCIAGLPATWVGSKEAEPPFEETHPGEDGRMLADLVLPSVILKDFATLCLPKDRNSAGNFQDIPALWCQLLFFFINDRIIIELEKQTDEEFIQKLHTLPNVIRDKLDVHLVFLKGSFAQMEHAWTLHPHRGNCKVPNQKLLIGEYDDTEYVARAQWFKYIFQ
jgi:hypothetical protein